MTELTELERELSEVLKALVDAWPDSHLPPRDLCVRIANVLEKTGAHDGQK